MEKTISYTTQYGNTEYPSLVGYVSCMGYVLQQVEEEVEVNKMVHSD